MNELNIGYIISTLRKERKLTQEELAKHVGVTVQAVSKWECGGNPDIELLPKIADFFNVSLDYLFNRDFKNVNNVNIDIARTINELPNNQRFGKIMDYCLAMQQGFVYDLYEKDYKIESFEEVSTETSDSRYMYSRVLYNEGIMLMRHGNSLSYFFAMPESQWGFTDKLGYKKEYVDFFSFLGNENTLKAVYLLYGQANAIFTIELLIDNLKISKMEANMIIKQLEKYKIITRHYEKDTNELRYHFQPNAAFVALLAIENEILDNLQGCFYSEIANYRSEQYLKAPPYIPFYML